MRKVNCEKREDPQTSTVEAPACAFDGCAEAGLYPAPRSRENLRDYIFLCLTHVRDYNKNWDYFADYDEAMMEEAIRSAATWDRPTWKFGTSSASQCQNSLLADSLLADSIFDDSSHIWGRQHHNQPPHSPPISKDERKAWDIFGLAPSADAKGIKKRYKQLAKAHHPDTNGGSTQAENKLKAINWAYSVLKDSLLKASQ